MSTLFFVALALLVAGVFGLFTFMYWLFEEDFNGDHRHE